jgi:non-specific serine/threonine protein kinase/serine/threonine-protein kinase
MHRGGQLRSEWMMTPAQWQQVKRLLNEALELGTAERAAFLASMAGDEAALRGELESLLRAHDARPEFLQSPCVVGPADAVEPSDSSAWVGRVLGSYRLLELIGEGGMGAVFRAVRSDGLHDRAVAVKLIRSGLSKDYFLRRFNEERRILASLDHPNIARLLDGGASEEGMPYVVMEFVDGVPIDEFCLRRQLALRDRLQLFRMVCGAVQYAHQNLVVHRDLKPANILVTPEGQPKLLDFGVAKIRDPRQSPELERSLTLLPIMTPEFASPEQVRGVGITTASDVYSLGVILYVLLTGKRPYGSGPRTPHEMLKAICETLPRRPSATMLRSREDAGEDAGEDAARPRQGPEPGAEADADHQRRERYRAGRALRGDIDSIVLKALRKDPHERYATVEQLSEDIRRHLEGLPVTARTGTATYHLRKFLARHAVGVGGAALISAALLAAVFISVREARLARLQQARAEARFNDVRQLANSLIFDIHDSIRNLPGAVSSRHLLINTALRYLDSLSADARDDPALQHEMAAAYQRLGEIQGGLFTYNDRAGALSSYKHALALLQAEIAADPRNPGAHTSLLWTYVRLSDLSWLMGDGPAVLAYSDRALAEAHMLATTEPTGGQSQHATVIAALEVDQGHKLFRIRGDVAGALSEMAAAGARMEPAWTEDPGNRLLSRRMAHLYWHTAEVWLSAHNYDEALAAAQNARRVLDPVLAANPEDRDLRINQFYILHCSASALMGLNRLEEAARVEQGALDVVQKLAASDPRVAEYHGVVATAFTRLGDIAVREGQPGPAIELLQQSVRLSEEALDAGTRHPQILNDNAQAAALLGSAYILRASDLHRTQAQRTQDWQSARGWYVRALASFRAISSIWFESIEEAKQASEQIESCNRMLGAETAQVRAR